MTNTHRSEAIAWFRIMLCDVRTIAANRAILRARLFIAERTNHPLAAHLREIEEMWRTYESEAVRNLVHLADAAFGTPE